MSERSGICAGFTPAMETHFDPPRKAGSAIAAALLLASTPLMAQDAATAPVQPVLKLPVSPAPPVIQNPDAAATAMPTNTAETSSAAPAAPDMISDPVIQTIPEQSEVPGPATRGDGVERVAQAVPPASMATSVTSRAVAPPEPASQDSTVTVAEQNSPPPAIDADSLPIAPPVAAESSPMAPADTGNDIVTAGLIASLLAMLGIAVLGLVLFRRSKVMAVPKVERPLIDRPMDSTANPTPKNPIERKKVDDIREWAQPVPATRPTGSEGGLPHAGAAIALPAKAPQTRAARIALLDQMVAARPDRANPFVSPKRRRHRAILILQSLGRTFENGVSRIDLSQYPSNWPELARRNMPTAA